MRKAHFNPDPVLAYSPTAVNNVELSPSHQQHIGTLLTTMLSDSSIADLGERTIQIACENMCTRPAFFLTSLVVSDGRLAAYVNYALRHMHEHTLN